MLTGSNEKTPFVQVIADEIEKRIKAGVKIKVIFDSIQRHDNAPRSLETFYKVYRPVIASARADIQEEMGLVVIEAAREGDWKAAEAFLKTRAGWNTTVEVEEVDSDKKEESGAIDDLVALLGLRDKGDEK
jgi:chromosomal replication initiation ATPase DnaA